MVTETQVREAEPILTQIDQLNALLGTINQAAAEELDRVGTVVLS